MTISVPSLHRVVPVKFFHFVPAKSSEAKPSLRSPFMSGRLYCLASTESNSCSSSATSALAISVFTRLSDKSVKLVLQTTLPVLPAITRQPGFFWFVVRDSCVERLFVCTSASSLIMMSSHWCAPPSRSRKTRTLWLPSSRSSGPLSGAALLLDTCSLLQPAQFFVRKRSSEKSEVLVTVSVLEAKSCGAETVPELVTSPQTTLPVDTPPLVAVKAQSRLSQSSGPVEAAPVMVSVPVAAKLAAVAAPEAVSVPVDTSPTVVKFPALAVLLMVRVLPVIPVAELSRPTLAAPVMLSELPDTAPVDDSVAPATVPAVSAAQETAPEASTPVVNTSVQFTSLHSSWSQPTLPGAVSPSSVTEPVTTSESASRSVTETDSPSKALALICMLYRSSVPAVAILAQAVTRRRC